MQCFELTQVHVHILGCNAQVKLKTEQHTHSSNGPQAGSNDNYFISCFKGKVRAANCMCCQVVVFFKRAKYMEFI